MAIIVNPKQIYTYEQMKEDIIKLEKKYTDIILSERIGNSVDGRKIYALRVGTGKTEIFMNGSHHAREWLTTNLLMNMIEDYCESFVNHTKIGDYFPGDILTEASIWFVPMVNPDGVTLVQKGHSSAKKPEEVLKLNNYNHDYSSWKANIRGVDLNRQYPAGWATLDDNVTRPGPMMYKGPSPLSEPETKAVYNFTLHHDFKIAVAYHSSGEELFWKYKSKGELLKTTKRIAEKISEKTGYQLVYPGPNPSGGGFTDWFLDFIKRPGFTPEISPLVGPRPVPLKNYDKIWNDNREIGLLLASEALLIKK
ncbi:M14 family metallopeptidase [Aquibacillus rhizosphaerae]|uniref:M14 family metallocarboxypeptidase n=1 Tax=Aquibacillus rhizosphaerae TaxID=3051431 RepID=A0ABT7L0P9_9BACI|nr:M14 family metallocarboxypeptidase [Aquibacillus sp. LR5S19]MDL4839357.1 M14 family metallocarboxypeptidase [Aquibacillus sp. LR5S19]